jgi:formylglycine-generating enzyme required for sulfatase activity
MHGNVDEWCADGLRAYDGASQVDPRGPAGDEPDALRALRGGSWSARPHGLRAACRLDGPRVRRYDFQGFRFSLRSTSGPEGSAERPPEAAVTRDA